MHNLPFVGHQVESPGSEGGVPHKPASVEAAGAGHCRIRSEARAACAPWQACPNRAALSPTFPRSGAGPALLGSRPVAAPEPVRELYFPNRLEPRRGRAGGLLMSETFRANCPIGRGYPAFPPHLMEDEEKVCRPGRDA